MLKIKQQILAFSVWRIPMKDNFGEETFQMISIIKNLIGTLFWIWREHNIFESFRPVALPLEGGIVLMGYLKLFYE